MPKRIWECTLCDNTMCICVETDGAKPTKCKKYGGYFVAWELVTDTKNEGVDNEQHQDNDKLPRQV